MASNRGFQAGINFIIVIILGIVIVGFGLAFFSNIFSTADRYSSSVGESEEAKLAEKMDNGEPVQVLRPVRTASQGEDVLLTTGITNNRTVSEQMLLNIRYAAPASATNWEPFRYDGSSKELKPKERRFDKAVIPVPEEASEGTHIVNISACAGSCSDIIDTALVYINVP